MENAVNHTFTGGMDQDTTAFKYKSDKYFEVRNMRLTVDEETQQYSLTTIDGNTLNFLAEGYYHGHCFIRDRLVLFLRKTAVNDYVYEFDPFNPPTIGILNALDPAQAIFAGDLGFTDGALVSAVGSYEGSDIRKVYFSDGITNLKVIDLDKDYTGYSSEDLDILPPGDHISIEYTSIEEGGQLESGMVQYTYLLYNENGSESYFAPASTILPITKGPIHSVANYRTQFYGGVKEQNNGKSIKFEITNNISTSKFDYIRVIGIYYKDLNIAPIIKSLGDYPFLSNTTEFLDTGGNYNDEYTTAEFTALVRLFSTGSLTTKFNHLFAADITESTFDVDFDARAYRFAESGTFAGIAKLLQTDGSYYLVYRQGIAKQGSVGFANLGDWEYFSAAGVPDGTVGTGFELPEGIDAICPDNYLSEDFTAATYVQGDHYYYDQEIGTTHGYLGGSGANVSYKITSVPFHEEYYDNSTTVATNSDWVGGGTNGRGRVYQWSAGAMSIASDAYMLGTLDNYASPIRTSLNRSRQRDEIYRDAIIFFDKYGRSSYAKWIGDIRIPKIFDTYDDGAGAPLTCLLTGVDTNDYQINRINIEYTVTISASMISTGVVGYQIVSVERNSSNSTVIDSGWLGSLETATAAGGHAIDGLVFPTSLVTGALGTDANTINTQAILTGSIRDTTEADLQENYKEYISPDINFTPSDTVTTTPTKFYSYGASEMMASRRRYETAASSYEDKTAYFKQYGIYSKTSTSSNYYADFDITSFSVFNDSSYNAGNDPSAYSYTLYGSNTDVYNYSKGGASNVGGSSNVGARGTCGICSGDLGNNYGATNAFDPAANYEALYVSRKNIIEPYGGLSYNARINSIYVPISPFVSSTSALDYSVDITGDTYIGIFEHIRTMISSNYDINDGDTNIEILYLPVESKFNVVARTSVAFYKSIGYISTNPETPLGIKEIPGVWTYDSAGTNNFLQNFYLYDYNNTYNRIANVKSYNPAPLGYTIGDTYRYDTKIIASEEKSNRELIDSWTKFLFNNEIELKTVHGPITKLDLVADNLISIQERAIASVAVREREQITGDTGVALTLGTGGILERYDYINTAGGCQSKFGSVVTPTGLYYYDAINKGIYALTQKGEPALSRVAFMDSYFKNQSYSGFDIQAIGYDREHNEVLFNFITGASSQETLVFNELRGYFTNFIDTIIDNYLWNDEILFSMSEVSGINWFWKQNDEESLTMQGSPIVCSLDIISRPNNPGISRFDYLEWNSIVKGSPVSNEQVGNTFDSVQCENTYQDTGVLSNSLFKRKMRLWRTNSLRDSNTVRSNLKPRLRSEWLKSKFIFTPNSNRIWIDRIKVIFQTNKV